MDSVLLNSTQAQTKLHLSASAEHEQPYTKVDLLDLLQCSIEHAQRLELPIAAQLQPCTCYVDILPRLKTGDSYYGQTCA